MANEVEINVTGRNTADQAMRSADRQAQNLGKSVSRVGQIASGIIAAGVFENIARSAVRAFTSTIRSASDLEQAVGGTEAVFGDASGAVDEFAKTSAESVGLSEREFRQMVTLVGGQLERMTGDIGLASEASIQLAEIAADLAATYGGTTKQAMDAFAAALRGEADPAERFNLNLKTSVVNAKAVELGLAATTSEVTETAKAQSILALITEQSADAQGQFARESDTAAVSAQKATAQIENTQATIGQNLLPVLATGASLLSDLLVGFQQLPEPVRNLMTAIGLLGAAAGGAIVTLRALGVTLTAVRAALGPIGIAAAAMGAAIAGLIALGRSAEQASQRQQELRSTLDETTGEITKYTRENISARLVNEGLAEKARELGIDINTLTEAYLRNAEAQQRVRERTQQVIDENTTLVTTANVSREVVQGLGKDAQALNEDLANQSDELTAAQEAQAVYREATGATAESERDLDSQISQANEELNQQKQRLQELQETLFETENQILNTRDAERQFEAAIDTASEAIEENGKTLDRNTEEGRANEAALDDIASSAHQLIQTQLEAGASTEELRGSMERARRKFIDTATEMGLTRDEAKELADQLGLIPSEVETTANLRDQATAEIEALQRRIEALERDVSINVVFNEVLGTRVSMGVGGGGGLTLAAGGIVGAEPVETAQTGGPRGNRLLVGELRPEVLELPSSARGSRVIPSVEQATDRNQVSDFNIETLVEAFRMALVDVRGDTFNFNGVREDEVMAKIERRDRMRAIARRR